MSDVEGKQAQEEALTRAPRSMSSRKAQLWAGMMRCMASEVVHQHDEAEKERAADRASGDQKSTGE